jgi:limonene-1,2-epoxide hydrolase
MSVTPSEVVLDFVAEFNSRDASRLARYLHPDVQFEAYGDSPIRGREGVVALWRNVFASMDEILFSTVHQVAEGDVVIAEQIHGLRLPGRALAKIMNMAIYRVEDGLITEWRDYTNPVKAQSLL